jgi:hypothetical protein
MRLTLSVIGLLISAGLLAMPSAAQAAAASGAAGKSLFGHVGNLLTDDSAPIVKVQNRNRVNRRHDGRRNDGRRDDGRRDRGNDGAAVAAGVLGGLLLGAIIANETQRNRAADYCARRYRSYDPRSGTFLGNDGRRYRCP